MSTTKLTSAVEEYLTDLRRIRASGGATGERSYYPPLTNLLNAIGGMRKPKVFCVCDPLADRHRSRSRVRIVRAADQPAHRRGLRSRGPEQEVQRPQLAGRSYSGSRRCEYLPGRNHGKRPLAIPRMPARYTRKAAAAQSAMAKLYAQGD